MKQDCRNDCVEALRFPRRPDNRPGLAHIKYRAGTYTEIREALLRNLDKTPGLAAWTHRGADDPGIALLEGAAILGDILTFYQELYANEAYLRTAQWRESIADLVRLVGYRLSPGLGGNATFAFEIKGDKPVTVPAHFPIKAEVEGLDKPADFETSAPQLAYPWLSKFNLYRRLFTPYIAKATNEFYIFAPDQFVAPVELKAKDRLLIGDADDPSDPTRLTNAEIVIVDSIRELHGRKLYKIKGALQRGSSTFSLSAFKLGRTFHHFGSNGPRKITPPPGPLTVTATTKNVPGGTQTSSTAPAVPTYTHSFIRRFDINTYTIDTPFVNSRGVPNSIKYCEPTLTRFEYPLDSELSDLPAQTQLIIQTPVYKDASSPGVAVTLVRTVASLRAISQTFGLVTGSTTVVTFNQPLNVTIGGSDYYIADAREMLFHEAVSPVLELRGGQAETTQATDNKLYFFGTEAQAQNLHDRALCFVKPGAEPFIAHVLDVGALPASVAARPVLRAITLDRDVTLADFPNEQPPVTVYGNLVAATEGKSEPAAPVGNGDNRLVFQTFKLPKAPLTYLISATETPPETPELQIYVNERLWQRVASFFGRGGDEEIYIVREDAENNSWVQFGDGQTGARLPTGIKNVVAKYRTGTGAFGALKAGTKAQAGGKLDQLDKIQMPDVAAGGAAPEDGANARAAAPGKIQSLDRLVSLADYESETLGLSGVSKVAAAWQLVDNIPQVVVTVLMAAGRDAEIETVRQTLAAYNKGRGANRFPVHVLPGARKQVVVNATFGYDETYLAAEVKTAIQQALGVSLDQPESPDAPAGLFSLRRRRFAQPEYATSIAGAIQQVAGVVWAEVKFFDALTPVFIASPFAPPLPLPLFVSKQVVLCDNQHVLSLTANHLQLTGVAETVREVK